MTTKRLIHVAAWLAALSLCFAGAALAQPSVGAAKKKANDTAEKQQKKENDKAQEPKKEPEPKAKPENKDPIVFAMGPDEKAHFEIDPNSKRNVIKFESKAPGETIEGKVAKVAGTLDFNPRKMDGVEGKFTVEWKDVDTGNPMRNQHMMGKDWVDASSHPEIVFTVTGFEGLSAKDKPIKAIKCLLVGKMALHGKEKEMKIPVTLSYLETVPGNPKKGEAPREGLAIKASKFKLALADFDIKGKAGVVGQKVAEQLDFATVSFMLTGPEHKAEKKQVTPKAAPPKPRPKGA